MKKLKTEKGITLIALVITIIVMLILVGVSVTVALNGGLFSTAEQAVADTEAERDNELALSDGKVEVNGEWYNSIDEYINGSGTEVETIPTETSYVGYYANLDDDAEPEGIIYADLAVSASGEWGDSDGAFSYEAITGTKNYYVSTEDYAGAFGTKDVLTATGEGTDRFYVMALEDIKVDSTTKFYWYYNAYTDGISNYSTVTSLDFGTGKANTATMISKWNAKTYGDQNTRDIWGVIQDKVAEGWFVPSRGEWGAFGYNLDITSDNYGGYGLYYCWSSSLGNADGAWLAYFSSGYMDLDSAFDDNGYVRLSATF